MVSRCVTFPVWLVREYIYLFIHHIPGSLTLALAFSSGPSFRRTHVDAREQSELCVCRGGAENPDTDSARAHAGPTRGAMWAVGR